jgi:hypothetical protein
VARILLRVDAAPAISARSRIEISPRCPGRVSGSAAAALLERPAIEYRRLVAWIMSIGRPEESPFMAAQAINAAVHDRHIQLYEALFEGASPLSRAERRAIAVTVSSVNRSPY